MPRERKAATIIAELRRELKQAKAEHLRAVQLREEYRLRAAKAEGDAADWRRRFDELLRRVPLALISADAANVTAWREALHHVVYRTHGYSKGCSGCEVVDTLLNSKASA